MPLWTLHVNVPITRRKSFHLLETPEGEIFARDRHLGPLLDLVWSEDQRTVIIEHAEARYTVTLLTKEKVEGKD